MVKNAKISMILGLANSSIIKDLISLSDHEVETPTLSKGVENAAYIIRTGRARHYVDAPIVPTSSYTCPSPKPDLE
jgi:hypothetical protein